MKFTLTITDMTAEDLTEVVTGLGYADHPLATTVTPATEQSAAAPATEQPAAAPATEQPAAAPATEQPAAAPATPELDADGLPWDERIHSSSKKQNQDGTWKQRRGTDENVKKQVEAELRGQVKQDSLPAEATPATEQPAAAPATEQPAAAPITNTLQTLMVKFQELMVNKKIQPNFAMQMVQDLNQRHGKQYQSIVDIGQDQAMVDAAFDYIAQKVQ